MRSGRVARELDLCKKIPGPGRVRVLGFLDEPLKKEGADGWRLTTMRFLSEDLDFVKDQISYHSRAADRFSHDRVRSVRHQEIAERNKRLADKIEFCIKSDTEIKNTRADEIVVPKRGAMRLGNLDELPPELLKELNVSESDQLELDIQDVIRLYRGAANIDEILVGLWRKTGKVHERLFVSRKLYRMTKTDAIFSVPKRKGMYALAAIDPNDIEEGEDESDDLAS